MRPDHMTVLHKLAGEKKSIATKVVCHGNLTNE